MTNFYPVHNVSEINLPSTWRDSPALNSKERIVEKDGHSFQLIAKERSFSKGELAGRRFLAVIAVIVSLALALISSAIRDLFTKTKEIKLFGVPYKASPQPKIEKPEVNEPIIIDSDEEEVEVKAIDHRAGISNYKASSCYFASTLQALASLPNRDELTRESNETSTFLKKVFSTLDQGKRIPVKTTEAWLKEARKLNLLYKGDLSGEHWELGEYVDPTAVMNNIFGKKESGMYSKRNEKEKQSTYLISPSKIKDIPANSSIQDILDGKTEALKARMVKDKSRAPNFFALNVPGRCLDDDGYDSRIVKTPHNLSIQSEDGQKVEYALSSAVVFQGTTSTGRENHYYTYQLSKKKSDAPTWIEYNDSYVQEHVDTDQRIQKMLETNGYIFLYTKV